MKTLCILLWVFFVLVVENLYSQNYEPPTIYLFEKAEDYAKFERDIIDGSKWLVATPFNQEISKRKKVSKFIFDWVNGSPTVNVELNATIIDFNEKNDGMLIIFMGSCAKYVLENNYSKDMRAKHKAALRDMITVYKSGKGIKKDKKMDKLVKADADGKLDEWLDENLKIDLSTKP
jgi:hypothetical protein